MQVLGLCRFSYPALGGFQVEHETIQERIDYLYAPERMEERFALFEAITLPALKSQTDPDFDLIVVIGDSLPAHYEQRLRDLCAGVRQIQIRSEAPARHRPIMRKILNEARRDPAAPCLQFRLDDDDAVAVDFVEHLRAATQTCAGLLKQHPQVAIDFNTGFLVRPEAGEVLVAEVSRPYQTAALGIYISGGDTKSVMNFGHNKVYQNMPTVTLNQRAMYVRSHNQFNDSRQNVAKEEMQPITAKDQQLFQRCFAIGDAQLDQLRALSRLR